MKSQQLEIKTKCDTCVFAVCKGGVQIGCQAERLEKFKEQGKTEQSDDGFYSINRFCNMHRKEEIAVEDAYNQIACKFGIAIFDDDEKYFNQAAESCKNIAYDKAKIKISIHSKSKNRFGRLFNEINEFKKLGIDARLFFDLEEKSLDSSEKEVFQYLYGCSHLIKLRTSDSIDSNFLEDINKSLNKEMEVFFTYQSNNVNCIPFWIVNQQYLNYHNYDLMAEAVIKESINNSMHKKYA
jgi:hypothetical protein